MATTMRERILNRRGQRPVKTRSAEDLAITDIMKKKGRTTLRRESVQNDLRDRFRSSPEFSQEPSPFTPTVTSARGRAVPTISTGGVPSSNRQLLAGGTTPGTIGFVPTLERGRSTRSGVTNVNARRAGVADMRRQFRTEGLKEPRIDIGGIVHRDSQVSTAKATTKARETKRARAQRVAERNKALGLREGESFSVTEKVGTKGRGTKLGQLITPGFAREGGKFVRKSETPTPGGRLGARGAFSPSAGRFLKGASRAGAPEDVFSAKGFSNFINRIAGATNTQLTPEAFRRRRSLAQQAEVRADTKAQANLLKSLSATLKNIQEGGGDPATESALQNRIQNILDGSGGGDPRADMAIRIMQENPGLNPTQVAQEVEARLQFQ